MIFRACLGTYVHFIAQHAASAVGSSMVYLLLERIQLGVAERVVGYYGICPTMSYATTCRNRCDEASCVTSPHGCWPKLALDRPFRGDTHHQCGAQLIREALEAIVGGVDLGGRQIIVVDADNPGLLEWCTSHGFKSSGAQNLRLYTKVATARKYPTR